MKDSRCARSRSCFFFSGGGRHTGCSRDWSSDVCSSDLQPRYTEGASVVRNHRQLNEPPTRPLRPVIPDNARTLRITAAAGTELAGASFGGTVTQGRLFARSEERRVGKEGRSRWSPYH